MGTSPFPSKNFDELIELNTRGIIEFPKSSWVSITPEARDLVERMAERDPNLRISAREASEHCWLNKEFHSSSPLESAIANLKAYIATE